MPYQVADASEIEAVREGRKRPVREALGIRAFGINQMQLPPHAEGRLHDESATGQEEVYLVLAGGGVMDVEGDEVELRPNRYVFVPAGTMRQVKAGSEGITWLCVGAPPGRGYEPPS